MVDSTNLPEVDINAIATDLNNKMDRDGVNASCPTLLSRTANSYGGIVEIWSDGYCVVDGVITVPAISANAGKFVTVTFDNPYKDTDYRVFTSILTDPGTTNYLRNFGNKRNLNSVEIGYYTTTYSVGSFKANFRTEGYIR